MNEGKGKKIRITANGPYEMHGGIKLDLNSIGSNAEGDAVAWVTKGDSYATTSGYTHSQDMKAREKPVYLCRCGHAKTKPFCDGAHLKMNFHGSENAHRQPYLQTASVQRGEAVDLLDDPSLCVGARFCDVGASVWRYVKFSGDADNKEKAIDEACKCPSGRLTIREKDGTLVEPKLSEKVSAVQDPVNNCRGPLWVQGGIEIEGANGEKYETRNRVTLCRCGESTNQPYCDGTHYQCSHMQGLDSAEAVSAEKEKNMVEST